MNCAARQLDMFGAYPETPGARATDTSQDAVDDMAAKAPALRGRCLQAIVDASYIGGLTADEVAALLSLPVLTVRPRVCELRALGKVHDSGKRRRNASGKRAIVWKVTL